MRLPHISHVAAFFAYLSKVRVSHIFPHKLAFSTAVLILFVFLFPISIRFRYLDHDCQQNGTIHVSGPMCNELVSSSLFPHISAYFHRIFGVYAIRIFLIKMQHKTDIPTYYAALHMHFCADSVLQSTDNNSL